VAGEVGVELHRGRRVDELLGVGIEGGQLLFQVAPLPQVELLVIVFRPGERADRKDRSFDCVLLLGGDALAAGEGELLLLVAMIKDDALVLPAAGALARVGALPEFFQELLERDLFRVVIDLE
jgi:hypothetical protein